ncbi:unnamed protein product [Orchesella dallaii]|uniref:Protein CutA n=1 Tax=Orchesella dallaii TaxID=48710 RepID=A0ABP1QTU8_9HEXA
MVRRIKEILISLLCALITGTVVYVSDTYPEFPFSLAVNPVAVGDPKDMNNFRAVFVTTPNIEVAKKIAHGLVSNKLAACVNIIPQVTSVYEWEGKINEDSELILVIYAF